MGVFTNRDSSTLTVTDGVIIFAEIDLQQPVPYLGNSKLRALNASDGSYLWDFHISGVVWNFMPAVSSDGTLLFSTHCGQAHSLDIKTGALVWKAPFEDYIFCGTGGGALGPNGVFYAVGNYYGGPGQDRPFPDVASCGISGCDEGAGIIIAYRASDGKVLAKRRLLEQGNQYPAVGFVRDGNTTRLAVVAALGEVPPLVRDFFTKCPSW